MKSDLKLSYEKQIKEMREKYEPGHSPAELIESRAQFQTQNRELEKENDDLLDLVENYKARLEEAEERQNQLSDFVFTKEK